MSQQQLKEVLNEFAKENGLEEEELMQFLMQLSLQQKEQEEPEEEIKEQLFETYDLKGISSYIKNKKPQKILVMTGAGISTAAGIPDFRTKGTGLYDNLQKYNLPYAEAIFDIEYFKENPKPFCVLAKEMWPSNFEPTPCHYFIKLLEQKGVLLRNYTQNIDTLERVTGMSEENIVEAHGCFANGHCVDCKKPFSKEWIKDEIFDDKIPICDKCKGLVKPDITFFGEGLPEKFHDLLPDDMKNTDLLIVIGTSLVVHPFASIATRVPNHIPRILINMDEVGPFCTESKRNVSLLGDCQVKIIELMKELEWFDDFSKIIPGHTKSFKEALEKLEKQDDDKKSKENEKTE
eukprot:gene9514-1721_t